MFTILSLFNRLLSFYLFISYVITSSDWREIPTGTLMLEDAYLDQPQCTVLDTRWICSIARNSAPEGHPDEHAEILYSDDQGQTWKTGIRLEKVGTPTNSYGNIIQTSFGRVIVVYNMNLNNITHFPNGTSFIRDDELGFMVYRFSDDKGETWSTDRYIIPLRNTAIDRNNTFQGMTQIFWSVDQIKTTRNGSSLMAYTKIGTYMQNPPEESFFVTSPNVLTEKDPLAIIWNLFPDGDHGIMPIGPPSGMNWEEAHVIQLEKFKGMFTICRTSKGYIGASKTFDDSGSANWSESHYATYSDDLLPAATNRLLKNPEGPITLKRFANGKYLLLFYFNSVNGYYNATAKRSPRNPYFISAGWESNDGEIHFSQPEIALYNPGESLKYGQGTGPGYPDFIEDNGNIFITETNKTQARVHKIDSTFLDLLFSADTINGTFVNELALSFSPKSQNTSFSTPSLPSFVSTNLQSITIGLWLKDHSSSLQGESIIDLEPLQFTVDSKKSLMLTLYDSSTNTNVSLSTDSDCTIRLYNSGEHLAAVVVDAPARLITFSVDGVVCDGGFEFSWGFTWVPDSMNDLGKNPHSSNFVLAQNYSGKVLGGGYWTRALMHTEIVGTWRAGTIPWSI